MAWNELDPSGYYSICLRVGAKRFKRSLKTKDKSKADYLTARVEENLVDVERGRIALPPNADLLTFLLSDGRATATLSIREQVTLKLLFDKYFDAIPEGGLEQSTLGTMRLHRKELENHFGASFPIATLSRDDLQAFIAKRAKRVRAVTIKKPNTTLRTVWNWGKESNVNGDQRTKLIEGSFPSKRLKYPKSDEKPPFKSFAEVQELTGGMDAKQAAGWWECVYLTVEDIEALRTHVKRNAHLPFVYPVFCFAAPTGARRSEIMRARVEDVDLKRGWITLRERKRVPGKKTTRRVPISHTLHRVLKEWLAVHPGGPALFCHAGEVARSKNRSKTTGHTWKNRPKSFNARMATVTARVPPAVGALTKDEMRDHFKRALANSKFDKLRGYHVLRHSFISCLASQGVDQRIIDDFVGHQSDEQRNRYRHLFPSVTKQAITSVFG